MPQLEFTAGLLDEQEPEATPEPAPQADALREHPGDAEAYAVFAESMGWAVAWEELGTDRDIPGPGRLPFVLAFRRVREQGGECPAEQGPVWRLQTTSVRTLETPPGVDHWGDWVRARAAQKACRPVRKTQRAKR